MPLCEACFCKFGSVEVTETSSALCSAGLALALSTKSSCQSIERLISTIFSCRAPSSSLYRTIRLSIVRASEGSAKVCCVKFLGAGVFCDAAAELCAGLEFCGADCASCCIVEFCAVEFCAALKFCATVEFDSLNSGAIGNSSGGGSVAAEGCAEEFSSVFMTCKGAPMPALGPGAFFSVCESCALMAFLAALALILELASAAFFCIATVGLLDVSGFITACFLAFRLCAPVFGSLIAKSVEFCSFTTTMLGFVAFEFAPFKFSAFKKAQRPKISKEIFLIF